MADGRTNESRSPGGTPDYRRIVSHGNIELDGHVTRHDHGLPIGNGRMGGLVWIHGEDLVGCRRSKLGLQVNRVDVFGFNSYSAVPLQHHDYCGGCGAIEVVFQGEPFPKTNTRQRLDIYDGDLSVAGEDLDIRAVAWYRKDVIAIDIDDERSDPTPIDIDLKMLRPNLVRNGRHVAESELSSRGGRMVLTQRFSEPSETGFSKGDHYCTSAVAVGVAGREHEVRMLSHGTARLTAEAMRGRFTIFISSSSAMNRVDRVAEQAMLDIDEAQGTGFDGLIESNIRWWHSFWSRSYVSIPDHPEFMKLWAYYLYLSACTMRGKYPAKFNGQIWGTKGDNRSWGGRYWWWNQGCMHSAFFASNHIELNDPLFDMRTNAFDAYERAAEQDWNSRGIFIPETGTFNGPEELPEGIAREIRKVFIDQTLPSDELKAFKDRRNTHESRWSWADPTIPVGWVSHVTVAAAKTADLFLRRYEYTLDIRWLRERAYPMLKGAAEFYRNYPNLRKEADSRYHIYNTSLHEHLWGAQDNMDDLALMRGVFAAVIKASLLLDMDESMRPKWLEILENLAQYPTCRTPRALGVIEHEEGLLTFAQAIGPTHKYRGTNGPESPRLRLLEEFDVITLESDRSEIWETAMATFEAHPGFRSYHDGIEGSETSRLPIHAARLGRADAIEVFLPLWLKHWEGEWDVPNGLPPKEGVQAYSVQGYGIFSDALQQALCQSIAPSPAGEPVIRVFPAWPRTWDASFELLCKGGFIVTSSMERGRIMFVEIRSQLGGMCRIRNPWVDEGIAVIRENRPEEVTRQPLLEIPTGKGEIVRLHPLEEDG